MNRLLTSLIALAAAGATPALAADVQPPIDPLIAQLTEICGVGIHPVGSVLRGARVQQCCVILSQVGVEHIDLLQAIAAADPTHPRLAGLSSALIEVLFACRQEALDRIVTLTVTIVGQQQTPRSPTLYTG